MPTSKDLETRLRKVDAAPDSPDRRDIFFVPSLQAIALSHDPRPGSKTAAGWWTPKLVRDQGTDPSCTGHALASAIDILLSKEHASFGEGVSRPTFHQHGVPYASAIMLFGNARLHDDWPGVEYAGSSLRGALKGFEHNGVCSIVKARDYWKKGYDYDEAAWRWHALKGVPEEAAEVALGSYRRVRPVLDDSHAAIAEGGCVVVTARVHDGWAAPEDGVIPFDETDPEMQADPARVHAFVMIGYGPEGFIVQNSWGKGWGRDGTAVWRYADWSRNVVDAWAIRLGVHAPQAFRHSLGPQGCGTLEDAQRIETQPPTRLDILGRFVCVAGGSYIDRGRYHVAKRDIENIAEIIGETKDKGRYRYRHLLLHFLGGTRTTDDAARLARHLAPRFEQRGIFPIFVSWEETMLSAIRDRVSTLIDEVRERVGPESLRNPLSALLLEQRVSLLPGRVRRELVRRAGHFFGDGLDPETPAPGELGDGAHFLQTLLMTLDKRHRAGTMSYHVMAHDLGASLVGGLLDHDVARWTPAQPVISTMHLVAPLITRKRFEEKILPYLSHAGEGSARRRARRETAVIEKAMLYALDDGIAARDLFGMGYPHSWPDLWARVEPMLGREEEHYNDHIPFNGRREQPRARILALAKYAREVEANLDGKRNFSLEIEGDDETQLLQPLTHFTLDASEPVITKIIDAILASEGPGNGQP